MFTHLLICNTQPTNKGNTSNIKDISEIYEQMSKFPARTREGKTAQQNSLTYAYNILLIYS